MIGGNQDRAVVSVPVGKSGNYEQAVMIPEENLQEVIPVRTVDNGVMVSSKEILRTLQRGQSLQAFIYLETSDGEIEEVEREVALLSPLVQRDVFRHSRGMTRNRPVVLPKQVSPCALKQILDYCRFHLVLGRSDKERKVFDEKFVRLDTRRLCELASASSSLDMEPLGDLTSRALARMIEGKTPEQVREIFHLPDDLTEEEKLEPFNISTGDPRIKLLNRLYARKRKELQEKKLLKSGKIEPTEKQISDERSVEDLVSFIDGGNKDNRVGKGRRSKNRRKKEQSGCSTNFRQDYHSGEAVETKEERDILSVAPARTRGMTSSINRCRLLPRDQDILFEEEYESDGFDPALKEVMDREVEEFARRLNSVWSERTQEILTLASKGQKARDTASFLDPRLARSNAGDRGNGESAQHHVQ